MFNNTKIIKKSSKLYSLSNILSIIIIVLILTIFELLFFFLKVKKDIINFFDNNVNRIAIKLNKFMLKKNTTKIDRNVIKNEILSVIVNSQSFESIHNLINKYLSLTMINNHFKSFDLSNKENLIQIIYIIFIIIFIILIILVLVILKIKKNINNKYTGINVSFNYTFIPNVIITLLLIIGFQYYNYIVIFPKYKLELEEEYMKIILDEL